MHVRDSNAPAFDRGENGAALFVGLISGTSADGIDAALLSVAPQAHAVAPRIEVLHSRTTSYAPGLRATILRVSQADARVDLDEFGALDAAIGDAFAEAALSLLAEVDVDPSRVRAIGSHGQTLRHRPRPPHRFTLQVGDPNVIAERTGCDVVADFRRRDVAAGGEGAPLMPAFHAAVLGDPDETRAVLNLGGIGNLTLLPPRGPVRGFDTGPANGLMDAWCVEHTGLAYDGGGAWASTGRMLPALLQRCLDEPWLALPPPKSSGRDQFHLGWLRERLDGHEASQDVQATLLEFSARSIVDALHSTQAETTRLIACGGGVHNTALMARLAALLPGVVVESSAEHGIDPDAVEAAGFAWLAWQTLEGRPGNRPEVTGAAGPRVLGVIVPGGRRA
ncbi:anhydro-N-acetylmuramic acid kinase [Silanimonas algicola]